ncbi:MAG TPA: hypothetical protein VHY78_04310 [Stellaceae bacterium]|jgi:hypothetical protein|nr:hypothetical protein [Stellaceae bacterium]
MRARTSDERGDFNQDRNVDLAPGQQLYVKIVSLDSWGVSVSGSKNIARDAFYAWVIPPEVAQAEIARDRRHAASATRAFRHAGSRRGGGRSFGSHPTIRRDW